MYTYHVVVSCVDDNHTNDGREGLEGKADIAPVSPCASSKRLLSPAAEQVASSVASVVRREEAGTATQQSRDHVVMVLPARVNQESIG